MSHTLQYNRELQYIHLTYHGEIDINERQEARDEVFQACEENQLAHVLVDMRDSDIRMSERDVIRFASSFQRAKQMDGYRLAVIIGEHNQTESLLETMITLEGINVKYFLSFDDGLNWLNAV